MTKRIKPGKPLRSSLASHHHEPEEEVRTITEHLQSFVEGREVAVFSLLAVILLAGGGFGVYHFLRANANSMAAERVSVAYAAYRETLFGDPLTPSPTPPAPDPEEVAGRATALEKAAQASEGTTAGRLGEYLAGNGFLRAGQPAQAIPLLERATRQLADQRDLDAFALQALAQAYEAAGQLAKAQGAYERLSSFPGTSFRAEGLLGSARTLWAQGKHQEAAEAYEKARAEFPEALGGSQTPLQVKVNDLEAAAPGG